MLFRKHFVLWRSTTCHYPCTNASSFSVAGACISWWIHHRSRVLEGRRKEIWRYLRTDLEWICVSGHRFIRWTCGCSGGRGTGVLLDESIFPENISCFAARVARSMQGRLSTMSRKPRFCDTRDLLLLYTAVWLVLWWSCCWHYYGLWWDCCRITMVLWWYCCGTRMVLLR